MNGETQQSESAGPEKVSAETEQPPDPPDAGDGAQVQADTSADPGLDPPAPIEQAPFARLQAARAQLNSALGSIEGADTAIVSATDTVSQLENELSQAQRNVAVAHEHSRGLRQSLHDACNLTEVAIRALRSRYPVE